MTHLRITLSAGLLAALLAACPGPKNQVFAFFLSGNSLYAVCKKGTYRDPFDIQCIGYVTAIADALKNSSLYGYRVCIPDAAIPGQLEDVTSLWLERNPQHRHLPAANVTAAALAEAFPCKN